jgi:hypothetical protein
MRRPTVRPTYRNPIGGATALVATAAVISLVPGTATAARPMFSSLSTSR